MIIAVWGSASGGKTLFSTRLGLLIAGLKKKTLILYTEIKAVDIAWVYPKEKEFVSMGELWQKEVDLEEMFRYFMTVPGYDNLAYLSYKPKENVFSYPNVTKFNVVRILSALQEIFDYIIVDCSSDLSSDMITAVSLEMADTVYRLIGTGIKDSFFFDSNLPLLADSRFQAERHKKILSNTKDYEPLPVYRKAYSKVEYELAFDDKLYSHIMEGGAAIPLRCRYDKTLRDIISRDLIEGVHTVKRKRRATARSSIQE